MNEDETLFLLSSTQEPYIKDALDLLFLPSGLEYRFRYEKKWLSKKFHNQNEINNLINKTALLIHIESILEEDGKYKITEFIPIRKAKIIKAKNYGEILWLSFSLDDWVKYENKKDEGLNQHHDYIKNLTPIDSKEYVNQIIYYAKNIKLEYIDDNSNDENVLTNWFNIVAEIYKLNAHIKINSIYTKLLSIKKLKDGKIIKPKRNVYSNSNNEDKIVSSYNFSSDSEYLIEILQYYVKGKIDQPFKFKSVVDETNLISLKQEDIIQGKYDLLKFIIKTRARAQCSP